MPAPSKCTDQIISEITHYVKRGVAVKYAAEASGISEDCFHLWMKRGKKDHEDENPSQYCKFFRSIAKVRAEFVQEAIENIKKAGRSSKNWQANSWLLEKLYGAGYGKDSNEVVQLAKDIEEIKRILFSDIDPNSQHTEQPKDDD